MQPHHSSTEEVQWQEQVARTFDYFEGVCAAAAEYSLGIVKRHLVGKRILEVGPADGYMTRGLVQDFDLTLVEPSETLCHKLRRCFPRAQVISTLVEDFIPSERIDDVLLCHVLDHVRDPEQVVRMAGTWLSPGGKIIAIAPIASRCIARLLCEWACCLPSMPSASAIKSKVNEEYSIVKNFDDCF